MVNEWSRTCSREYGFLNPLDLLLTDALRLSIKLWCAMGRVPVVSCRKICYRAAILDDELELCRYSRRSRGRSDGAYLCFSILKSEEYVEQLEEERRAYVAVDGEIRRYLVCRFKSWICCHPVRPLGAGEKQSSTTYGSLETLIAAARKGL